MCYCTGTESIPVDYLPSPHYEAAVKNFSGRLGEVKTDEAGAAGTEEDDGPSDDL